jgi:hypothetical protein
MRAFHTACSFACDHVFFGGEKLFQKPAADRVIVAIMILIMDGGAEDFATGYCFVNRNVDYLDA